MIKLTDYGFSAEHQQIYDAVSIYARGELHPLIGKMDQDDWFPEAEYRRLNELGILGTTVSAADGGPALDLIAQGVILEALSYWCHGLAASWLASENLCVHNLVRNASENQRRTYLPRFVSGAAIGALGLTEPAAGSDALGGMRTTARRDGDDYLINGSKMFITNGPVADVLLIYAKTSPDRGAQGISAFIVEKDFAGFSVAQKLDKMGWRGSPTSELVFEDCRVPAQNLLGTENKGVAIVMSGLDIERIIISFHCLGIAQRALDLSVAQAKERRQFGAAIGSFQLIQGMLADMYTSVETIRAFTYQLAKEINALPKDAGGQGLVHRRAAAVALHAGRTTMDVLDKAAQIHGGMGFMRETEINQLYRAGKLLEVGAGTTQIRQLIVAEELLK